MSSVHLNKKVFSNSLMVSAESLVLALVLASNMEKGKRKRLQDYFHKATRHNVQSEIVVNFVLGNHTLAYGYQTAVQKWLKHYFRISL